MNHRSTAVAELQSAILISVISISLAAIVYSQVRVPRTTSPVFSTNWHLIGGATPLLLVQANSSGTTRLESLQIDGASGPGVLSLLGAGYSMLGSLCQSGTTTFFSVVAPSTGPLTVNTDGESWISGHWASSLTVEAGVHEVIIVNGSRCSVSLPNGSTITSASGTLPVPADGSVNGSSFHFFIPWKNFGHILLIIFQGGVERVEV